VKENFIAVEGMYTGQFVYCGKSAQLKVGNVLPLASMPEGAPPSPAAVRMRSLPHHRAAVLSRYRREQR
jgi:hypothetical protein